MTGRSPISLGVYRPINKNAEHGLPLDQKILPQYLAGHGYQSYMVGKWHLGHHARAQLPNARGFEHAYGSLTGGIGYWNKIHGGGYDWNRNGMTVREEGYATHLLTDEVLGLLDARDRDRPNFLYVAFQAPHMPNEAPQETVAQYADSPNPNRRDHAAMVAEMDQAIGKILDAYKQHGMLDNTLVVFFSDNGGLVPAGPDSDTHTPAERIGVTVREWFGKPAPAWIPGLEFIATSAVDSASDNTPLPGGKTLIAEGGVRVPAAIWWPGTLESAIEGGSNRVDHPITVSDVLPTILQAIGEEAAIPEDLDGQGHWRTLLGEPEPSPDYAVSGLLHGVAVYRWPYKFSDAENPQLFDVMADPLEQNNLAHALPDKVAELNDLLTNWTVGPDPGVPYFDLFFDPDTFGGKEDRIPWADRVVE